jgi:putative transposase
LASDITYVPMARARQCRSDQWRDKARRHLVAIVGLFSRKVLAWRLSITLSADFCVEALEEALARHGKPEIFSTDQGSRFTSTDFTKVLRTAEIAISMDGKLVVCWTLFMVDKQRV